MLSAMLLEVGSRVSEVEGGKDKDGGSLLILPGPVLSDRRHTRGSKCSGRLGRHIESLALTLLVFRGHFHWEKYRILQQPP